ncbi:hypothetical protein [Lederbergia citrea]|uniref:hypothetical protein n=1 Tax=Lederbergia citrea TaxID=2833581 RepID=UPI001BC99050|nr:hypothetical protein [Lederbergia citrea]MBS4176743.1 hypothetical protein [Lederbergia citrea]MBS4203304.1 hypothetical protein [Lederbergia citrea]
MQKPNKDFLMDMLFGIAKGKSIIKSDIAKTLEEPFDTIQTVKRLFTHLEAFHEDDPYNNVAVNKKILDQGDFN